MWVGGDFKLLNYLMNNVKPFETFWKSVCKKQKGWEEETKSNGGGGGSPSRKGMMFEMEGEHSEKPDTLSELEFESNSKSNEIISTSLLVKALRSLHKREFLCYNEAQNIVIVSDMFMIDTVYGIMPFKQRKNLHTAIALWHKAETIDDLGERMRR